MAPDTVISNARVVERGADKGIGVMANVTLGVGRHVGGGFADGEGSVVTTAARADDLRVVDSRRRGKDSGGVARFARVGGGDVGSGLAGRRCAVMAAYAVSGDAGMTKRRRTKNCRVMTGIALRSRRNVIRGLADRDGAVMTGTARTDHLRVIDAHGGRKRRRGVTRLAGIR